MPNAIFVSREHGFSKVPSLLKSGRYQVGGNDAAINNGCLVRITGQDANQREVYLVGATAAITNEVFIVDTVERIYSQETTAGLNNYTNAAGEILRLRKPQVGDHFAISSLAIDALNVTPCSR